MPLRKIQADLFTQIVPGVVIPHVVNNQGAWGAGFVVPLGKRFPEAKRVYLDDWTSFSLGDIQWAYDGRCSVVNMYAQTLGGKRPLNYEHLVQCMKSVHKVFPNAPILAPRFGSRLAGGNWNFIRELVHDIWVSRGMNVTICYL